MLPAWLKQHRPCPDFRGSDGDADIKTKTLEEAQKENSNLIWA